MSKSWTSPPHAVNLRQFFSNIYNLRLFRNFLVISRRRACSRYRKIFPAWKNVKYQYGQGAKCSGTNTEVFHSQACTFPEESFILSSPCNSAPSFPTRQQVVFLSQSSCVFSAELWNRKYFLRFRFPHLTSSGSGSVSRP
jgi:hypothetical protein